MNLAKMYANAISEMKQGNMELLPELHSTTAGLKAFASDIVCSGIEVCKCVQSYNRNQPDV